MNIRWIAAIVSPVLLAHFATAAEPGQVDTVKFEKMVAKAISYLETQGQADDGSYSAAAGIGPTALVTAALLRHGRTPADPTVAKGLAFIDKHVQPDGGIYIPGTFHRNYETSIAVMCLAEANADGRYDQQIKRASDFLKGIQWDEGEGTQKSDTAYGGAGYGSHKRPDLSNTSFLIDALRAAGSDADDEAIQRALIFVSRAQNLETEHNTTEFAAKNPDGGFYYTPAAGGQSEAGETESGGLRSYGSMTYAGLKSMIYAGVKPDDPRVKAAYDWIRKHYRLGENPNMGAAGLYYYYHTFAKALDAIGEQAVVADDGTQHNWRAELVDELAKRQQPDGSWVNADNIRWLEGDANLVTGYALLALSYCKPSDG